MHRAAGFHRGNPYARGHHAVDDAFAEFCRKPSGQTLAEDLVDELVASGDDA